MIAAFSFCKSDYAMALELAKHIHCLGGVRQHHCLILHPESVDSREIADLMHAVFGKVTVETYVERFVGWPDGPNQCFQVATTTIFKLGGKDPWLWLEADCVPTHPEWLDQIQHEHRFCGQPILGALENTFGSNNKVIGQHVTGVAVYPHDWLKQCPPLRSLIDATEMYRRQGNSPPAFDTYCAPYSVPLCATGGTMRHYWKSFGYVEHDGIVTCEFKSPYGALNEVDMRAALIHGCKDYSLLDLVQKNLTTGFVSAN